MNNILIYTLLGVGTISLLNAQSNILVSQAKDNANAMIAGDYEKSVDYLYPPVVERMGGKDAAIAMVLQSMQQMETQGSKLLEIEVGVPSEIVREGDEDVAIVPVIMRMKHQSSNVRVHSYLVAISSAGKSKWAFMDGVQLPKEKIQTVFPALARTVEIPERRNFIEEEIEDTINRIEQKEGKPIDQVIQEGFAESKRVIALIESNGLRAQIEREQGAKLEKIPSVTLKRILREKGYQ